MQVNFVRNSQFINQRDRRDPTASTRHFVARSLRDLGYTSFGHDFQELGVAASSGVLNPVLKIKREYKNKIRYKRTNFAKICTVWKSVRIYDTIKKVIK